MLRHQPGGSDTVTYYLDDAFPFSTCFQITRSATCTYWAWSSLPPWNKMKKKGEEWLQNADTAQHHQAEATAGLVCVSRDAIESNIQTQSTNTEGRHTQAAKRYRQHLYPYWRHVDAEISRKLCKAKLQVYFHIKTGHSQTVMKFLPVDCI
jgi:hypothetical protein